MESEIETRPDPGIGGRVAAARKRLDWSREELAVRSGMSWAAIAQIEAGRRTHLRPTTLSALAGALGVTIDYLVHGHPPDGPMLKHVALIYGDADEFARSVEPFAREGIERGETVMVVTTPANIDLIRRRLGRDARRVDFGESADWYAAPDATFGAYEEYATGKLEGGAPWVRVVGEPLWTGKSPAEARQWLRYESLINLAFASWPVTVLCPYDARSVPPKVARQACASHPETIVEGVRAPNSDYVEPGGFMLQADT